MLEARSERATMSSPSAAAAALAGGSLPREGWMRPRTNDAREKLAENERAIEPAAYSFCPHRIPSLKRIAPDAAYRSWWTIHNCITMHLICWALKCSITVTTRLIRKLPKYFTTSL